MIQSMQYLYISPLEKCNLACKICYTNKSSAILKNDEMLDFINRYRSVSELKSVMFCGGEVFALKDFPDLVNTLIDMGIFVQIITNGTIDKLSTISNPNMVNIIVSIDGLPDHHDKNRGEGNFDRSVAFLEKAKQSGFHIDIFSIVTKENLKDIEKFEKLFPGIAITYHPRKPMYYLKKHPINNKNMTVPGFGFISDSERKALGESKKIFPPLELNCFQPSLMSDGKLYACCEGIIPIGDMLDDMTVLLNKYEERIRNTNCVEFGFKCGYL